MPQGRGILDETSKQRQAMDLHREQPVQRTDDLVGIIAVLCSQASYSWLTLHLVIVTNNKIIIAFITLFITTNNIAYIISVYAHHCRHQLPLSGAFTTQDESHYDA